MPEARAAARVAALELRGAHGRNVRGGVHEARVDVAELLQREEVSGGSVFLNCSRNRVDGGGEDRGQSEARGRRGSDDPKFRNRGISVVNCGGKKRIAPDRGRCSARGTPRGA